MRKKFSVLVLFFAFVFILTGCGNPLSSRVDQIINSGSSLPTGVTLPYSKDSIYQNPVKIQENASASEIVDAYLDCVVTIFVCNANDVEISFGSGVCVYSGGYILTNNHVIEDVLNYDNYYLSVYLNNGDEPYYADVLWTNESLDISIIQCENGDIPFVNLNDRLIDETEEPLQLLEQVIAIGTPLDYSLQNTCTIGYISGLNRYTTADNSIYEHLIQHTASISNGNSGGPLFDMKGNLIGLNTLGSSSGNDIYFAVSVYPATIMLQKVIELNEQDIRTKYVMPKLGVSVIDEITCKIYNQNIISEDGLYISNVSGNALAKLNIGDIIKEISFNNQTFEINCRNDLIYALLHCEVGQEINITIKRINEIKKISVVLN